MLSPTQKIAKLRRQIVQIESQEKKRLARLRKAHRHYGYATTNDLIAALQSLITEQPAQPIVRKKGDSTRRLTPTQRRKLRAVIKAGATSGDIVRRFRISYAAASYHIKRAVAAKPSPKATAKPAKPTGDKPRA